MAMESTKAVEVELEEIATAEEKEEKESRETKEVEGNVYSALSHPSDHVYGEPAPARTYSVNEDIERKVRVYRIISVVLFTICLLLTIVVFVLFVKVIGKQSCQIVEPKEMPAPEECNLKKCQEMYQLQTSCMHHDCGRGWLQFENSCYFLSKTRLSWRESREECQKRGGDLAIITKESLQRYLSEKGNVRYWIGLNQVGTNQWIWNNNTVLTVRYWGNKLLDGNCALLAANEQPERSWHQYACNMYLHYICQKTRA
nr:hepatic lectin isoform X1 [Misgurnus anguillicaudatus]